MEVVELCGKFETRVFDEIADMRGLIEGQNKFNIIHMNIRSLRKNFEELNIYLDSLNLDNVDVMIFSETFDIDNCAEFQINGFQCIYSESRFNKNDGLILYAKNKYSMRTEVVQLTEIKIIKCELFLDDCCTLGISSVYRPPSTRLCTFLDDIEDYLTSQKPGYVDFFLGDINVNLLDIENSDVNRYLNILYQSAYFSCINKPTRETELSSTLIDHLFIRSKNITKLSDQLIPFVFRSALTDHYMIGIGISMNEVLPVNVRNNSFKDYKTIVDNDKLNYLLNTECWGDVLSTSDAQCAYSFFLNKFMSYYSQSMFEQKLNSNSRKRKAWMTHSILTSIHKRDELKRNLNYEYTIENHAKYKKYRNMLNKIIKTAKSAFYQGKIGENKGNSKKLWETIHEITNSSHKSMQRTFNIEQGQDTIEGDENVANCFNKFFIEVGRNIHSEIGTDVGSCSYQNTPNSLYLKPVTHAELILQISSMKNSSSAGEDRITSKTIKAVHTGILTPLEHIINLCFSSSVIPKEWKLSTVTPVYKGSGSSALLTNYRPISVINNFGKIFEKCLKDRIVDFLENNELLNATQFGFRQNKGTEDAVFELIKFVYESLHGDDKALAVFLDLKKAFDSVSHDVLLHRAENVGIRGNVLKLIENYLTNRKQRTKINNSFSSYQMVETGVPQGTVLGPILFLIYVNEINCAVENCKIISYADDTVLVFRGQSWRQVYDDTSRGMRSMTEWLSRSRLCLNFSKTSFLTFSATASGQPNVNEISIHSSDCFANNCRCCHIVKVEQIKYLGIVVDQHLKWSQHVNFLCGKVRKLYHKFYQLREIVDSKISMMIYASLVESVLGYCIVVWGAAYSNSIYNLQVVQNTVLKIIFSKPRLFPTKDLYHCSQVLNMRNLYCLCSLVYLPRVETIFSTLTHCYETRGKENKNLEIPLFRKTLNQKFSLYLIPKMFNCLPNELRRCPITTKNYRKKMKEFILCNPTIFEALFL